MDNFDISCGNDFIVAAGDTFIVNCQLSILHSKTTNNQMEEIL